MRYPASEKLEIIRLVERSHLPVRRTLDKLGIPATTFYRWYDRYRAFGEAGLADLKSGPDRVWNRIPDDVRRQIVDLALDEPELSPRELAVTFTDTKGYFVSEASAYRLLKAHDLITSPASSSSRRRMHSRTRPRPRTSCGRPTSPTSRSSAGVGSICRRSWTTTRATSSPGSFVRPCGPRT
jgi:transposase-like protein